jgi:hypothetical protein
MPPDPKSFTIASKTLGASQNAILRRAVGSPCRTTSSALGDQEPLVEQETVEVRDVIPVFLHHLSADKLASLQAAGPGARDVYYLRLHALLSLNDLCTLGSNSHIERRPSDRRIPLTLCAAGDRTLVALSAGAIWGWAMHFLETAQAVPIKKPNTDNLDLEVVLL